MRKDLTDFDIREAVAAACHQLWSSWMTYLIDRSITSPDEQLILPAELTRRYTLLAATSYDSLKAQDKASARNQADLILKALSSLDDLE